jgi:hypothetical protein
MKKEDARSAFTQMFNQWAATKSEEELAHPRFTEFCIWVQDNGYSHYFNFRSVAGSKYDVEAWFDKHFSQRWRD